MLNGGGIYGVVRKRLWSECALTATLLNNEIVKYQQETTPFELFYRKKSTLLPSLRTFGEMGVVKDIYDSMHSKLLNMGKTMMFVGYYLFHSSHVYRILNLETKNVFYSNSKIIILTIQQIILTTIFPYETVPNSNILNP